MEQIKDTRKKAQAEGRDRIRKAKESLDEVKKEGEVSFLVDFKIEDSLANERQCN
jgi:hypothetical protein